MLAVQKHNEEDLKKAEADMGKLTTHRSQLMLKLTERKNLLGRAQQQLWEAKGGKPVSGGGLTEGELEQKISDLQIEVDVLEGRDRSDEPKRAEVEERVRAAQERKEHCGVEISELKDSYRQMNIKAQSSQLAERRDKVGYFKTRTTWSHHNT